MQIFFKLSLQRGFTLIEICIVISVLLLISAMSMIGIQNFAQRQAYTLAIEQIRQELYATREKTLASYDDARYGVYIGTSTIEFFKGDTPQVGATSSIIFSYQDLDIIATSSFSNGLWYSTFSRVTGTASATGTIEVADTHRGATTTFTISASGLIE